MLQKVYWKATDSIQFPSDYISHRPCLKPSLRKCKGCGSWLNLSTTGCQDTCDKAGGSSSSGEVAEIVHTTFTVNCQSFMGEWPGEEIHIISLPKFTRRHVGDFEINWTIVVILVWWDQNWSHGSRCYDRQTLLPTVAADPISWWRRLWMQQPRDLGFLFLFSVFIYVLMPVQLLEM